MNPKEQTLCSFFPDSTSGWQERKGFGVVGAQVFSLQDKNANSVGQKWISGLKKEALQLHVLTGCLLRNLKISPFLLS